MSAWTVIARACMPSTHVLQQEKPAQWEAYEPQLEWPLLASTGEKPMQRQRPSTAKLVEFIKRNPQKLEKYLTELYGYS